MTLYAALLRGVNVGGVNLKMAAVAEAFTDAGFTDVQTILASGNVLLTSRAGVDSVRKAAEKALRDAFGYDAWLLAYSIDAIAAISRAFPFTREVAGVQSYVTFVSDPEVLAELGDLDAAGTNESNAARGSSTGRSRRTPRWTAPSARRWARSAISRRRRRATCARSRSCCAELGESGR